MCFSFYYVGSSYNSEKVLDGVRDDGNECEFKATCQSSVIKNVQAVHEGLKFV